MGDNVQSSTIHEATRAVITFSDGRTRTLTSPFQDSQRGAGYDGGTWGPFPEWRDQVEREVRQAQRLWGLPDATIRYTRITRTTQIVERVTTREAHYSERTVRAVAGRG